MTHRLHPDPSRGEDARAVLYDDCERCDEQSGLVGLDPVNVWTLWRKMERKDVVGDKGPPAILTENEGKAVMVLYRFALTFEILTGIFPTSRLLQTVGEGKDRARGTNRDEWAEEE